MSISFVNATPSFPVTDIAAATEFYVAHLGFEAMYQTKLRTLLVRDSVGLLLRREPYVEGARTGACRIGVKGVKQLHRGLAEAGVLSPDCEVKRTDFGNDEFTLCDPDHNTITFYSA